MSEKQKPKGFVATCQCGKVVGAMDYDRTDRSEAGKLLGAWLAAGCSIVPRFSGAWRVTVESCECAGSPAGAVAPGNPEHAGFTPDELLLGYVDWKALSESRRGHLLPDVRAWLNAWKMWDLACSPMDDAERRQIRYGHYLGWWERSQHNQRHADALPHRSQNENSQLI